MKKVLVHFRHKSVKEYWDSSNWTKNKIMLEVDDNATKEDIEIDAESKILDLMDIFYPSSNGAGYDTIYGYGITKIEDVTPCIKDAA